MWVSTDMVQFANRRCCLTVKQMWGGSVLKMCQKRSTGKESLSYTDSSLPAVSGAHSQAGPVARKLSHHFPPVQSSTWRLRQMNLISPSPPNMLPVISKQHSIAPFSRSLHCRLMATNAKSTWTTLPEMDKWRYHTVISLKQANWMKIIERRADTVVELKNYQQRAH